MKKINYFLLIVLFGFGIAAETAYAAAIHTGLPMNQAPVLSERSSGDYVNVDTKHNARRAFAPYAQVVPNSSYTFIGVSHPSLGVAHTSIGLVIEALNMTHPTEMAGNGITQAVSRAVAFTINAGETHRVFIVNEGHATINALNTAINNSNTHLIRTKDTPQFGNIRVTSVGTRPNVKTSGRMRGGGYKDQFVAGSEGNTAIGLTGVQRFDNLNMLAMWGVVYQESNGAGFSLEFIGDMHDSTSAGTASYSGKATDYVSTSSFRVSIDLHKAYNGSIGESSAGVGRGIN